MSRTSWDMFIRARNLLVLTSMKWGRNDLLTRTAREDHDFWRHHAARKTPLDCHI